MNENIINIMEAYDTELSDQMVKMVASRNNFAFDSRDWKLRNAKIKKIGAARIALSKACISLEKI